MIELFKKKWFRKIFRRRVFVILLLIIQIILFTFLISNSSLFTKNLRFLLPLVSTHVALYVISQKTKKAFKVTWVFLILEFPILGGILYLFVNFQFTSKKMSKKIESIKNRTNHFFHLVENSYENALKIIPNRSSEITYLQNHENFPIFSNTKTEFLPLGEIKFEKLKEELQKAEYYIFMEYFIVQEGKMWNEIFEILKEKAKTGVLVRLIYDDIGCFLLLPNDFPKIMAENNIECTVFNPFRPFFTVRQNNRDHRKITVIDGKVAFTGGINIADEYINEIEKHGHWKDTAIMLKGDAAWAFTVMFLQMWELHTNIKEDYEIYFPKTEAQKDSENMTKNSTGFVQPYSDSPMDNENVGEHVYLQILNKANEYVYIYTPYLILDDSIISSLSLAAKSGVDVRIITPNKCDKKIVHMTTQSYYRELIKSGVKIYEYSKGFLHAKCFVSDNQVATVGSANLDFRSLYLHFECGTVIYNSSTILDIKADFLKTQEVSKKITLDDCKSNFFMTIFQEILRLFAPLM